MDIKSVREIIFSPTKTTGKIVKTITRSIGFKVKDTLDLTIGEWLEEEDLVLPPNELAVIGVPVYGGRMPVTAVERLEHITAEGTPAVLVVVYGNRHYEDALLELRDLTMKLGFVPAAGSAFIGEHSFHSDKTPIAPGRPDNRDLEKASEFGKAVSKKLNKATSVYKLVSPDIPGNFPYKSWHAPEGVIPYTESAVCTLCGTCARVCPVKAVTIKSQVYTDADNCILCSACVKMCPERIRVWKEPKIEKTAKWLSENCSERREPEIFL